MRILIADDDDIALELVERALTDWGHEVHTARDGREALEIVCRESIRMVISDWMMPAMDGIELCEQIRTAPVPGYVYIILLTSRHEKADIIEGLSAGADDFIVKPFDPTELRVRVRVGERIVSLETQHVAVFAMAKLAESRDPETGHHLERIRNYARVLAGELSVRGEFAGEISQEYIETIYLTSPLHDIGKVGIPDCILLKPGRLTDHEFEIMKAHSVIGGGTLAAAVDQYPGVEYLRMARDIALTHHERFDGSGYPRGLRGEEIPLCGRIVALADVYDALTSKRVYKEAFAHDVARNIILEESGDQFDPNVVKAFRRTESRFIETREQYAEVTEIAA